MALTAVTNEEKSAELKIKYSKINIQNKLKNMHSMSKRFDTTETLEVLSKIYHQHIVDNDEIEDISNNIQTIQNKEENIILVNGFFRQHISFIPHDLILTICAFYHNENIPFIEQLFEFESFHSKPFNEADFITKPMVLLLGQYSSGKTSFIRYLLGRDYPCMRIGPEPTTAQYMAIMNGEKDAVIAGVSATMPFSDLRQFGNGFLRHFSTVRVANAPILKHVSFIDTPGIFRSEKNKYTHSYEIHKVFSWFGNKCDKICLFFDAHMLDISDEYKEIMKTLKPFSDKICCVINKADCIRQKQLLRVYGAIMWCLGALFTTHEVFKVYMGSFWNEPYYNGCIRNALVLDESMNDFIDSLLVCDLPKQCCVQRIRMLSNRMERLKVHALSINHFQKLMLEMNMNKKGKEAIFEKSNVRSEMKKLAEIETLNLNNFSNPDQWSAILQKFDITKFPQFRQCWRNKFDDSLNMINNYNFAQNVWPLWSIKATDFEKHSQTFYRLILLRTCEASGNDVKKVMIASGLPMHILSQIWDLSDIDQDGKMDIDEFVLCMHLIQTVADGGTLPSTLHHDLVPPRKRHGIDYRYVDRYVSL